MKSKNEDRHRRFYRKPSSTLEAKKIRPNVLLHQALFAHDRGLLPLVQSVGEENKSVIRPKIDHVPIVQGAIRLQFAPTKVQGQNTIATASTLHLNADTNSSSSDHVLDSRDADRNAVRSNQPSRSNVPLDPSMTPASQYYGGHSAAVISPGGQYPYNTTPDYNTPSPSARSDGRYYSGSSSSHQIDNSSTSGDYYPTTAGYYPADIGYSSADTSQDYSYLAPSDQDQWLTGSNADVFVGAGTNEYYYVDDAEASRSARN
ncbi:hypothetical protein HYFRA_00001042 [Hymenoscyphus fraxineus]|uniref:Uncharacterized protein n=1 Tax=Hymenoscyphus fraxineus TaxID=746836 RepID=A0A9N9PS91_9HELO|nr:hypothetical protein HYFRA_00001042 [Hymenoscyphus fraxineus]